MKTGLKYLTVGILAILSMVTWSCNNDDEGINTDNGQMTAIVRGENWKAETVNAGTVQGRFSLSGIATDGSTISFALDSFGEGTYNSSIGSSNTLIWQPSTAALGYTSIAPPTGFGQVVIEELNEQEAFISGTFFFIGVEPSTGDTVSVVGGIFSNVPFATETGTVGENALKAKIDGTLWEATTVTGFDTGDKLQLVGASADGSRAISMLIPKNITSGEYAIGSPFSEGVGGQFNPNSQTSMTSETGMLVISSHDTSNKTIEGTFEFEAAEFLGSGTASITEGSFYIKY